ncbi:MAG: hypothetical protein QM644_14185 [Mobilitalea sp.]
MKGVQLSSMKTTPYDKNTVFLRGRVQGKYISPKVSRLYVTVRDYQQKADGDGRIRRNTVTITFYGREGLKAIENVNKYDHVDVKGIMQSIRDPKTNKWSQECWGLEVNKTPTLLELATRGEVIGDTYPEDDNVVVVRGKVSSCHGHDKHWITVTVKTMIAEEGSKSKYLSNTSMTWYVEDAATVIHELEREGTEVAIVGKIESVQRSSRVGRAYMFENVTVRDLKIISTMPKIVTSTLVNDMKGVLAYIAALDKQKLVSEDDEIPHPATKYK